MTQSAADGPAGPDEAVIVTVDSIPKGLIQPYCYKIAGGSFMAREENIQRLRELATRLGRSDVSGSAAELSQRVMEWEEEAGGGAFACCGK